MKNPFTTGPMLFALVFCVCESFQPALGQPDSNKPQQRMESIERPILGWDDDGKRILGHVDTKVILWDAATGKMLQKLVAHKERIFSVRFSPDGLHAFTSSWMAEGELGYKSKDTRTVLWDLTTGEKKADFPGQVPGEFSADGKLLLTFSGPRPKNSASFDAVVWDPANGAKLASSTLDDCSNPANDALHFSADGQTFALIKHGRCVTINDSLGVLYDAINGRELGRSARQDGGHRFTSNGELASLDPNEAILKDLHSGRVQSTSHDRWSVLCAAWTHDGKRVAAEILVGKTLVIKIFDVESRTTTAGVKAHPEWTNIAIVSPDNHALQWRRGPVLRTIRTFVSTT